jgi:hypothetical protein
MFDKIPTFLLSDTGNLYFMLCLALAVFVVYVHCLKKFEESTVDKTEDDYIAQLLPRHLATREEYSRALIFYIISMVALVVVLSALGPRAVGLEPAKIPEVGGALPLFIALALVGVFPSVPWLQDFEPRLRRYAHERAFIPAAARAAAQKLAAADFDFSNYKKEHVLRSPAMRGVELADFDHPRDSIDYAWARLSCVSYELKRRRDAGLTEPLVDGELLQRYASDLDSIAVKRRALEDEIAHYRKEKLSNPYFTNDQLHRVIRTTLRQLYVLLGCAVRLKQTPNADMDTALRPFGFVLGPTNPRDENNNVMIMGLAVMTACLFVLVFAAVEASQLWARSVDFPRERIEPFYWSFSAVLAHGTAIFIANRMRHRRTKKGLWFAQFGSTRRQIGANYLRVACGCFIAGYGILLLWGLIFGGITLDQIKGTALFALLPAATGGFYVYHLDNVELEKRPSRLWEIGLQAMVTAFCGFVAANTWVALDPTSTSKAYDYVLLVAALGATVGASLAWYIPMAAEKNKRDPLANALDERIMVLKAKAIETLGNADLADRWLETPFPILNDQSPKDAAVQIVTFEKAVGLLERPHVAMPGEPVTGNPTSGNGAAAGKTGRGQRKPGLDVVRPRRVPTKDKPMISV